MPQWIFAIFSIALLSACTSLPRYENPILGGVTPKEVVQAIGCELLGALPKWKAARKNGLVKGALVAVADMTLQVDQQATLAPSFTHTDIVSSTFSRVFGWGVKLDTTALRIYSESVVFLINPGDNFDTEAAKCQNLDLAGHSITSDLGLRDVIERGVNSGTSLGHFAGTNTSPNHIVVDSIYAKAKSSFGQTVQFVVTMNVNSLGPTWSLRYFKGPGNMFLAQRVDTHKVIVSFADYVKATPEEKSASLTEQYLELICQATVKSGVKATLCPSSKKVGGGGFNLLSVRPYNGPPNAGAAGAGADPNRNDPNLDAAINQARENNARLRSQGIGNVLGSPP